MAAVQHTWKAYKAPNGGIILVDETAGLCYLFADAAPADVHAMKVFNLAEVTASARQSWQPYYVADSVSAILPNIKHSADPMEAALAGFLQEQTWDQTEAPEGLVE